MQPFREAGLDDKADGRIISQTHKRLEGIDEVLDNAGHGIGVERKSQEHAFGFTKRLDVGLDGFNVHQVVHLGFALKTFGKLFEENG